MFRNSDIRLPPTLEKALENNGLPSNTPVLYIWRPWLFQVMEGNSQTLLSMASILIGNIIFEFTAYSQDVSDFSQQYGQHNGKTKRTKTKYYHKTQAGNRRRKRQGLNSKWKLNLRATELLEQAKLVRLALTLVGGANTEKLIDRMVLAMDVGINK